MDDILKSSLPGSPTRDVFDLFTMRITKPIASIAPLIKKARPSLKSVALARLSRRSAASADVTLTDKQAENLGKAFAWLEASIEHGLATTYFAGVLNHAYGSTTWTSSIWGFSTN